MATTTAPSSELLRRIRWPAVLAAAAAGLIPHIILLYSAAIIRLETIVVIHAIIVPALTWIALWRLEQRAENLEAANVELRQSARALARRNEQIDALNTACRLLAGTPSIATVLQPLTHMARRVAQARSVTLTWHGEADADPVAETAMAFPDAADGGGQDDHGIPVSRKIDLMDADHRLGTLELSDAATDEFTRNSIAVLASEVGLTWRLRHVEGHTLSALSDTAAQPRDLDGERQAQHLLAAVSKAVEARGAGLYIRDDGAWRCRAAYGSASDTPPSIPPSGAGMWHSADGRTLFLKGAADGVLALHGVSGGNRAMRALNIPLLRVVTGHGASLLRVTDTCRDLLWNERQRIARDLHDDVCQTLAFLHMQLVHLADLIAAGRHAEASTRAGELRSDALDAYDAARRAVDGLRQQPAPDEETGAFLARVAHSTCERLDLSLEMEADPVELGRESAWQLGRILQEAITNAARHGEPHRVHVGLHERDGGIELVIEDDGGGVTGDGADGRSSLPHTQHGLSIMRERLSALEGTLEMLNGAAGVRIVARLPGTPTPQGEVHT